MMKLYTKDGHEVVLPYDTKDFRGDAVTIVDYRAPHKAGSTGRVYTADGREVYPSVVNLVIKEG